MRRQGGKYRVGKPWERRGPVRGKPRAKTNAKTLNCLRTPQLEGEMTKKPGRDLKNQRKEKLLLKGKISAAKKSPSIASLY